MVAEQNARAEDMFTLVLDGDTTFTASRNTLTQFPDSMLGAMLSGCVRVVATMLPVVSSTLKVWLFRMYRPPREV